MVNITLNSKNPAENDYNPQYVQVHKPYTDFSINVIHRAPESSYAYSNTFHTMETSNVALNTDICENYIQLYSIQDNSYVDVHETITRDISVNRWLNPELSGNNPQLVNLGNIILIQV